MSSLVLLAFLSRPAAVGDLPPVVPGFRWTYCGTTYEVLTVDGGFVRYANLTDPTRTYAGLDGATERNQQSIGRTLDEAGLKK